MSEPQHQSERDRLLARLDALKAEGRIPPGFSIPPMLARFMTDPVAAQVNALLDQHFAREAAQAKAAAETPAA